VYYAGSFDALGFAFQVACEDARLTDHVNALFATLASPRAPDHSYVIRAASRAGAKRYDLSLDAEYVFETEHLWRLFSTLVQHVNRRAVEESDGLVLHSGGVERDRLGLIFPGGMESGKTTLVAGLVRAGLGYLTDEAVALDRETLLIHPYPKPLSLDPGSQTLFRELEPRLDASAEDDGEELQWQIPPTSIRPGSLGRSCPVSIVMFPHFERGSTTVLEPLRRAEALVELAKNTFGFEEQAHQALDLLADVIRAADCYRLPIGALDEAVSLVSRAVEVTPQGERAL
jgi:hypothetical protein